MDHACSEAHHRNRDSTTDFYTYVKSNEYEDDSFPVNDAIYWVDDGGYALASEPVKDSQNGVINWMRPDDSDFLDGNYSLFGLQGVTMSDIT